jgi:hypothetical protein
VVVAPSVIVYSVVETPVAELVTSVVTVVAKFDVGRVVSVVVYSVVEPPVRASLVTPAAMVLAESVAVVSTE